MTVRLGSNINSLTAQRHLADGTGLVSQSYERLSSGMRINKASDDAAGLAVSTSLSNDSRIFSQALKNVNDGLSLLNIAQGALIELTRVTDRQLELAEQSANGVYTASQRQALQKETDSLVDEYNRIVVSTSFNGRQLFSADSPEVRLQLGYGVEGSIAMTLGAALMRTVGTGTFATRVTYVSGSSPESATIGDFNGDGINDLAVGQDPSGVIGIFIGNGDGTFKNRVNYSSLGGSDYLESADLNGDGNLDLINKNWNTPAFSVLLGNGNGTFKAQVSYSNPGDGHRLSLNDFNGDGILDVVAMQDSPNDSIGVLIGNGNGSFKAAVSYQVGGSTNDLMAGDLDGDGRLDLVVAEDSTSTVRVLLGNGNGSFRAPSSYGVTQVANPDYGNLSLADLNRDGSLDILSVDNSGVVNILLGNGDGSFKARRTFAGGGGLSAARVSDLNGDGFDDIAMLDDSSGTLNIMLGNGDGTFRAPRTHAAGASTMALAMKDLNRDGVPDILVTDTTAMRVGIFLATTTSTPSIPKYSISTRGDARSALDSIRATKDQITKELGAIGATESRLSVALRNLGTAREN